VGERIGAVVMAASSANSKSRTKDRTTLQAVQIKADTSAYPEQARPVVAPSTGRGRHPRPPCHHKPASLKLLALAAGQSA
jgi:hypothetical protein